MCGATKMRLVFWLESLKDFNNVPHMLTKFSQMCNVEFFCLALPEKFYIKANEIEMPSCLWTEVNHLNYNYVVYCGGEEVCLENIRARLNAFGISPKFILPYQAVLSENFSIPPNDNLISSEENKNVPELLFFTYANAKYHMFAAIYPIFALTSNPNSVVEICISDYEMFQRNYGNIINFYNTAYAGKVFYTPVRVGNIIPNSVRFLAQPTVKSKYVYIGDVDIFLLDSDILQYHLFFMEKHKSDFSNVLRNENQLTGLHFIKYDNMYPVCPPPGVDLKKINDEVLLCRIMREKNLKFPVNATFEERKIHGVHVSFFRVLLWTR